MRETILWIIAVLFFFLFLRGIMYFFGFEVAVLLGISWGIINIGWSKSK